MQKKIIALAIASAFAAPVAMADVTMYGTMDGGMRHQTNSTDAAGTTDSMRMGQYNSARFGLKSVEDMGDGMKSFVTLETSYAPAGIGANADFTPNSTGTVSQSNPFGLLFDRTAIVGISGGMGSLSMGWDYSTSWKTIFTYDPFAYKYSGLSYVTRFANAAGPRAAGMQYTNKFGDVSIRAEYNVSDAAPSHQPVQMDPGRALAVTYASGDINVGAAYSAREASPTHTFDNSMTHMTAGAGYKFGDGKVSVGYAKKATKTDGSDNTDTNIWLGADFNMTNKVALTAAYYKRTENAGNTATVTGVDADSNQVMVGATYALSKMTSLYLGMDRETRVGAAADGADAIAIGTSAGLSVVF